MNTGLLDPRDTVPRPRLGLGHCRPHIGAVPTSVPGSVRQAMANVRSAIVQLERADDCPRLSDAVMYLRSAEGALDRLTGC